MQNPLKNLRLTLPPEVFQDLKVRLVLLLIFGASVALLVWTLNRPRAWDKKLELENRTSTELEGDIQQLEKRWNTEEAGLIASKFKQSHELLFAGQDELVLWQTDIKRRADQFTVSVNPGVTKTQDCPLPGKRFFIFEPKMDLRPITPGIRTNSPYLRLLNFTQNLTSEK